MDISLSDVVAFREIARLGSVSAASRSLGITQPTLSWAIKKMENKLGVELFMRTNKGVKLTRKGQVFFERSSELERGFLKLKEKLDHETSEVGGSYTLGVHPTVGGFTLPRFLEGLLREYPELNIKLVHDLSRNVSEGVINHTLDFGIVVNPPNYPDLTIVDLYRDTIKFWRLKDASDLQQQNNPESVLVLNPDMLQTEEMLREAMAAQLFVTSRTLYTTDLLVMRNLVGCGAGIGLLPQTVAESGPWAIEAIEGSPVHHDHICLIFRPEIKANRAGRIIRDHIVAGLKQD